MSVWQKCDNVTLHAWLIYHVVWIAKIVKNFSATDWTPSVWSGSSESSESSRSFLFTAFLTDRLSVRQTTCCSVCTAFWLVDLIILQNRIYTSIQKTTSVDKNQFCLKHLYKMNFQWFRSSRKLFHTVTILYSGRSHTMILNHDPIRFNTAGSTE